MDLKPVSLTLLVLFCWWDFVYKRDRISWADYHTRPNSLLLPSSHRQRLWKLLILQLRLLLLLLLLLHKQIPLTIRSTYTTTTTSTKNPISVLIIWFDLDWFLICLKRSLFKSGTFGTCSAEFGLGVCTDVVEWDYYSFFKMKCCLWRYLWRFLLRWWKHWHNYRLFRWQNLRLIRRIQSFLPLFLFHFSKPYFYKRLIKGRTRNLI